MADTTIVVYECDRCGAEYRSLPADQPPGWKRIERYPSVRHAEREEAFDFCADCVRELAYFLQHVNRPTVG